MLVVDAHRPVGEVARELDVHHEMLRNSVAALQRQRAALRELVSADERAEIARLRRRVAELETRERRPPTACAVSAGCRCPRGKPRSTTGPPRSCSDGGRTGGGLCHPRCRSSAGRALAFPNSATLDDGTTVRFNGVREFAAPNA